MKKLLVLLAGCVAGVLIVGVFVAYRMGAFNSVELVHEERGPYRVVCLPHTGAYNKIAEKIVRVEEMLKAAGVPTVVSCGIYYDNPVEVAEERLRSKGGCVVEGEVAVEPPFEIEAIPRRDVLVARFEGHPAFAPLKIYPAISAWLSDHGYRPGSPAVEFYRKGLVECEMPIDANGR